MRFDGDKSGHDLKNAIFIIDSLTTAMMVSIIASGTEVNCVFEFKYGVDTDYSKEMLLNFSKKCINIRHQEIKWLENPYFLYDSDTNAVNKFVKLGKFRRKILAEASDIIKKEDCIFIGSETSSIMRCLTCCENNIYYLFHGTVDIIRYYKKTTSNTKRTLGSLIKSVLLTQILKLKYSPWNDFFPKQGFSLCDLNDENIFFLDLMEFNAPEIETELQFLKERITEPSVLFCPWSSTHNKDGIDADTKKYNSINVDILKDSVAENEHIFIKFHPALYTLTGNTVFSDLNEFITREIGNVSEDVMKFIPDSIGGSLLPTEVLFRYIPFKKIICVETSTIWYLSRNKEITKVMNYKCIDGNRRMILDEVVDCMTYYNVLNKCYKVFR